VPIDPHTGARYFLPRKSALIVQLWAYRYESGTLAEIAQVRG